jgi:hypothetical protein
VPEAANLAIHHALILVSWGLVIALVTRATRDRKVGEAVHQVRGHSWMRPIMLAACTGLVVVLVRVPDFPVVPSIAALGLSAVLTLICPARSDRAVGESGLAHGWTGCTYGEVESWSFARGELRFQHAGAWHVIEVPQEVRARALRLLMKQAGGRQRPE